VNIDQGTNSEWGQPFREWAEGYENMGWISWCFDDSWAPTFFDSPGEGANEPWTLKDGDEQMGGYIKTWLEETQDDSIPESTIDDSIAPPAPSNLTVSRTSEISVEVSWDAVTDEGEAGLSHYAIAVDGEPSQESLPDTTSASVTDLDAATTYEIAVRGRRRRRQRVCPGDGDRRDHRHGRGAVALQRPPYDPGRIEAEDFDEGGQGISYYDTSSSNQGGADYRDTAVDVGTSANSGYNVGYIDTGEWLEYSVQVDSGDSLLTHVNAAAGEGGGGTLRIDVDDETVATQDVWQTGGWSNWEEIRVGSLDLPAGEHIVRVTAEAGAWNFDWIEFGDGNGGTGLRPRQKRRRKLRRRRRLKLRRRRRLRRRLRPRLKRKLRPMTRPRGTLVVNDYDGGPSWSSNWNDLGQWCGPARSRTAAARFPTAPWSWSTTTAAGSRSRSIGT